MRYSYFKAAGAATTQDRVNMKDFIVAWNEGKTEGVIFAVVDGNDDEALDDAYHAAGGECSYPSYSSIADSFREAYGDEQKCSVQRVRIDNSKTIAVHK